MGLAISVGILADLIEHDEEGAAWCHDAIKDLNGVLDKSGLPAHEEPETLPSLDWRGASTSFPYSFLHYLRRAYGCHVEGAPLRTGPYTADDDEFVMDVTVTIMDSHLLSHSDCEGFYVPIPMDYPLCDDRVPGGFLGSSVELRRELIEVAPLLDIPLDEQELSVKTIALLRAADSNEDEESPIWRERLVWFTLWEACRHSIARGALIAFH